MDSRVESFVDSNLPALPMVCRRNMMCTNWVPATFQAMDVLLEGRPSSMLESLYIEIANGAILHGPLQNRVILNGEIRE